MAGSVLSVSAQGAEESCTSKPPFIQPASQSSIVKDCLEEWMKPLSKEALSIGQIALSGTLDKLLKGNPSIDPAKEILSYALDILEQHIEKKLNSRKTLEMGESGTIEI